MIRAVRLILPAVLAFGAANASAATVYDTAPGLAGNQSWGGTLGLNFSVTGSVSVDSLGVFDSNGDGLSGTLYATIYDAGGTDLLGGPLSFAGTAGTGNPYLYQSVTPLTLAAGTYQLASWGYSGADQNYNNYGPGGPITFNTLGGQLTALGTAYSGTAGGLATIGDTGATRYGAGSFTATMVTPPSPPPPPPPPPPPGPAGPGVYDAAAGLVGNQNWGGTLGLDFTVTRAIKVSALGAFDSGSDGITGTLRSVIYDSLGNAVTPLVSISGQPGNGNAYLFQSLAAPVILAPGTYQIASWGYDGADANYNNSGPGGPVTFDTLSGRLTAIGSRYSATAGGLATIGDTGATRYGAGSFIGAAVPEPANWALMIAGFGLLGAASRRRRAAFA